MKNLKSKILNGFHNHLGEIIATSLMGGFIHVFWVVWVTFPNVQAKVEKQGEGIEKVRTILCERAIVEKQETEKIKAACHD